MAVDAAAGRRWRARGGGRPERALRGRRGAKCRSWSAAERAAAGSARSWARRRRRRGGGAKRLRRSCRWRSARRLAGQGERAAAGPGRLDAEGGGRERGRARAAGPRVPAARRRQLAGRTAAAAGGAEAGLAASAAAPPAEGSCVIARPPGRDVGAAVPAWPACPGRPGDRAAAGACEPSPNPPPAETDGGRKTSCWKTQLPSGSQPGSPSAQTPAASLWTPGSSPRGLAPSRAPPRRWSPRGPRCPCPTLGRYSQ